MTEVGGGKEEEDIAAHGECTDCQWQQAGVQLLLKVKYVAATWQQYPKQMVC